MPDTSTAWHTLLKSLRLMPVTLSYAVLAYFYNMLSTGGFHPL